MILVLEYTKHEIRGNGYRIRKKSLVQCDRCGQKRMVDKNNVKRGNGYHYCRSCNTILTCTGRHPSIIARRHMSEAQRGRKHSEETKRKIGDGNRGKIISENTRQKIREARLGKSSWNKGIPRTPAERKKISESHKGKKLTPEHIKHLADARKGIKRRPPSEETKQKMSRALKGRKMSKEWREKISKSLIGNKHWVSRGPTWIEKWIYNQLVSRGFKLIQNDEHGDFYRNYHIESIANVDFFFPKTNIIIETDGCLWHACPKCNFHHKKIDPIKIRRKDAEKTKKLLKAGFKVIRIWEHTIKDRFENRPFLFWKLFNSIK